jgi:ribosomal-protein-alanine N-acetyltransferase
MEKTMETARLLLRPLTMDDAADVFDYSRNCEVGPSAGWKPHESLEETKTILREQFVGRQDVFGIVLKQTGRVIGIIALLPDPRRKNERARMVDCALAREYWCSGYMTEAAQAVLEYAFRDLRLELVAAYCSPNNGRVRRVLEKCGFQYEGSLRRCETRYDGVKLDADCWSRLTEAAGKIESQR